LRFRCSRRRKIGILLFFPILTTTILTACSALGIFIIPKDYATSIAQSHVTSSREYRENDGFDLKLVGVGKIQTFWGPAWRTIWTYYTTHINGGWMIGEFAVIVDIHGVLGTVINHNVSPATITSRGAVFSAQQYMIKLYKIPFSEIDYIHATSIQEISDLTPGWLISFAFHDLDLGTIFFDTWGECTVTRQGILPQNMPNNTVSVYGAVEVSWDYIFRKGHHYIFERAWLRRNDTTYTWYVEWNYCVGEAPPMREEANFTLIHSIIAIDGRFGQVQHEEITETSQIMRSIADQKPEQQVAYGDCDAYESIQVSAQTDAARAYIRLENISVTTLPKIYDNRRCWEVIYSSSSTGEVVRIYVDASTCKAIGIAS